VVLTLEFVAKKSHEVLLRDEVAVTVQPSRRHDDEPRHARRLARSV
jgi:hypothetical protein